MKEYTKKEMKILEDNPYTLRVTKNKLSHTAEFKKIFWTKYQAGESPRKILTDLGYDPNMFGQKRIDSLVQHIKKQALSGNGFSEGSIIHGIRFSDANFNALIKAEKVYSSVLKDADEFVIRNLSYILHGDDCHYKNLKRIKNKSSAIARKFKCIPYFIEGTNGRINQFRMSTGENMLISLLHMLNAVIIHNGKIPLVRLILIDEIELALHLNH